MENTTANDLDTCPECGLRYEGFGSRNYRMLNHMINKGEMTVGDAKAELEWAFTPEDRELLAGWILHRSDQGDDWKAGMPVRLPDGTTVAYEDEGGPMDTPRAPTPIRHRRIPSRIVRRRAVGLHHIDSQRRQNGARP